MLLTLPASAQFNSSLYHCTYSGYSQTTQTSQIPPQPARTINRRNNSRNLSDIKSAIAEMAQQMANVPERLQYFKVDGFEDLLWSVELNEEHDEDTMIRQLLEVHVADVVVLQQNSSNNTQHLQQQFTITLSLKPSCNFNQANLALEC